MGRWVKPVEVLTVVSELDGTVSDSKVEKLLQVDRYHLGFLESAGLISRPSTRLRPLLPMHTHYRAASIDALLDRLKRPLAPDCASAVPLDEAARVLGSNPTPWAAILVVIATSSGYGVRSSGPFFDWRKDVFVTDIERFKSEVAEAAIGLPPVSETISAAEAAAILKTSVAFVGRAIKRGALSKLPCEPARLDRTAVELFDQDYIFGEEFIEHFGVGNGNTIRRRLASREIHPAFAGERRDLIYRRRGLPTNPG